MRFAPSLLQVNLWLKGGGGSVEISKINPL
jgi:hypothetical protein